MRTHALHRTTWSMINDQWSHTHFSYQPHLSFISFACHSSNNYINGRVFYSATMKNVSSTTDASFVSPKCTEARKRTVTEVDETASMRPNKKAQIMALSNSSSLDPYTPHSIDDSLPPFTCCFIDDKTMMASQNSMLVPSPPSMVMSDGSMSSVNTNCTMPTMIQTTTDIKSRISHTNRIYNVELHIEFLRTLKKLNKSMQRTDQSRTFFLRALVRHHHYRQGYFTSPEWYRSQQERQQMTKSVHYDSLHRTVFWKWRKWNERA